LQAKDGSELDGRAIKVLITSKEASKFEAAAAKVGGGSSGSNGGSNVSRRLGGKAAFALQVFNLAWEVTDADLMEHFQDCPVSGLLPCVLDHDECGVHMCQPSLVCTWVW
jgi:hypothetical protein